MKLAICNETFQDWPLEKAFHFAADCGYDGIEIAPFTLNADARAITRQQRDQVRAAAAAAELEVIGLHWLLAFTEGYYLTSPDVDVRRRTSDYLKVLAELCRDVGGRVLVLGSPKQRNLLPGVSHEQAMEYAAEVIRGAEDAFTECNVVLAVEPLGPEEGDFLNTAALGRELVDMIAQPYCRLHLDVKAMSAEATPIPEIIRASRDYVEHFHANDANRRGPGMGEIDFDPIVQTLKEIGYDQWISVEVFDYEPGIERLATESIACLRRCLGE